MIRRVVLTLIVCAIVFAGIVSPRGLKDNVWPTMQPPSTRYFAGPMRLAPVSACACLSAGVAGADGLEAGVRVPAAPGRRTPIRLDANGGFVVGGLPTFLIALSNPPPLSGRSPAGLPAPVEVVRTGVNLVRVGPAWTGWTRRELEHVLAWDRIAVLLGVHTWVRLNAFAATQPRWRSDGRLSAIVHMLTRSRFGAGIGLWQARTSPGREASPPARSPSSTAGSRPAATGAPAPASRRSTATILS